MAGRSRYSDRTIGRALHVIVSGIPSLTLPYTAPSTPYFSEYCGASTEHADASQVVAIISEIGSHLHLRVPTAHEALLSQWLTGMRHGILDLSGAVWVIHAECKLPNKHARRELGYLLVMLGMEVCLCTGWHV